MINTLHIYSSHSQVEEIDTFMCASAPSWYKETLSNRKKFIPTFHKPANSTVAECPSFIDMFKNSYLVRMPCDFVFRFQLDPHLDILYKSPLPFLNLQGHSVEDQMHKSWAKDFVSVKLSFNATLTSNKKQKMMFLAPQYEQTEKFPGMLLNGVVTHLPNHYLSLNIHFLLAKQDCNKDIFISKDAPVCYLYFPDGKPKLKTHLVSEEEWHQKRTPKSHYFEMDYVKKASLSRTSSFLSSLFRL